MRYGTANPNIAKLHDGAVREGVREGRGIEERGESGAKGRTREVTVRGGERVPRSERRERGVRERSE